METEVNVRTADVKPAGSSVFRMFVSAGFHDFFCIFLTSKNIVWFQFGLINRRMTPPMLNRGSSG